MHIKLVSDVHSEESDKIFNLQLFYLAGLFSPVGANK